MTDLPQLAFLVRRHPDMQMPAAQAICLESLHEEIASVEEEMATLDESSTLWIALDGYRDALLEDLEPVDDRDEPGSEPW